MFIDQISPKINKVVNNEIYFFFIIILFTSLWVAAEPVMSLNIKIIPTEAILIEHDLIDIELTRPYALENQRKKNGYIPAIEYSWLARVFSHEKKIIKEIGFYDPFIIKNEFFDKETCEFKMETSKKESGEINLLIPVSDNPSFIKIINLKPNKAAENGYEEIEHGKIYLGE